MRIDTYTMAGVKDAVTAQYSFFTYNKLSLIGCH